MVCQAFCVGWHQVTLLSSRLALTAMRSVAHLHGTDLSLMPVQHCHSKRFAAMRNVKLQRPASYCAHVLDATTMRPSYHLNTACCLPSGHGVPAHILPDRWPLSPSANHPLDRLSAQRHSGDRHHRDIRV